MEEKKIYTLGLDIGTNSVGWAVVDQNHNLAKAYGHSMWGVRMFEESSDAGERRTYRNSRRRLARRKERIKLLQEIFKDEINNVDSNFFERLNDSFYHLDDKKIQNNKIFDNYKSNKEYYDEYPTIRHLRNSLVKNKEKQDIRLIYLAVHHILKYRGNFLYEGNFDISNKELIKNNLKDFIETINDLNNKMNEEREYDDEFDYSAYLTSENFNTDNIDKNIEILEKIILDDEFDSKTNITKSDKKKNLISYLGKNIYSDILPSFLISKNLNLKNIKIVKDNGYDDFKIDVDSEEFESKLKEASDIIPEISNIILKLENLKKISDFYFIKKFCNNSSYISDAFLNTYNCHNNDLKKLKKFYKKYLPNEYAAMFRKYKEKTANYVSYIGSNSNKSCGNKEYYGHCKQEDFYKYLKKDLEKVECEDGKNEAKYFFEKIENDSLLLRCNSPKNGAIPYQLHLIELKTILENQKLYYPFLNKSSDNLTNIEKIIKIMTFKRPYYVGPLKGDGTYNWAKLNESDIKVTPWNFDKIVDKAKSGEIFINRMQNKCTYLKGEDDFSLSKASIYFQAYNVLSYINKIRIDGNLLSCEIKQNIFKDLFLKYKNVTKTNIIKYLNQNYGKEEDDILIDVCNVKFSSFISFRDNLYSGDNKETLNNIDLIEKIINDLTIFNDKEILRTRFKNEYKLNDDEIKKVLSFNFKEFGRLGSKILNKLEISCVTDDGEVIKKYEGILPIMWETNYNLEEILHSNNYTLKEAITLYNNKENKTEFDENSNNFALDWLKENAVISPIWIRPFIQSYRIIKEIRQILKERGEDISYYSLECTRSNKQDKNKRTKSRYENILDVFNSAKELENEFRISSLKEKLEQNKELINLSDKIYLYFAQLGKDIYSLEDINFDDLEKAYDIDHIYPQAWIKDNSLSNRVLTKKEYNNDKGDTPLCELREKGKSYLSKDYYNFYKMLLERNLITKAKFNRLTEKEIDTNILNNFVNRQKTATDQATKTVIELLKFVLTKEHINEFKGDEIEITNQLNSYLNKHIIYSKAENISDFRQINNIYKSRTANNYHHAHDAYLNAILGKTLKDYYDDKGLFFIKDYQKKRENKDNSYSTLPVKIFDKRKKYSLNGKVLWNGEDEIKKIYKTIAKNFDIRETRLTTTENTFLSKVTILKKGKGTVNVKNNTINGNKYLIEKYGGFDSPSYMYYSIIKFIDKKDNITYKLIPINKVNETNIMDYLNKDNKFKEVSIVLKEVRKHIVLERNRTAAYITGVSNGSFVLKNFIDRNFSMKEIKLIHDIDKFNDVIAYEKKNKIFDNEICSRIKFSSDENNKISFKYKANDLLNNKTINKTISISDVELKSLFEKILKLWNKDIYSYSNIKILYGNISKIEIDYANDRASLINFMEAISEMLFLLKTNERKAADLTFFNLPKNSGIITFGGALDQGTKLISYSPTGLKKKIIFEVK